MRSLILLRSRNPMPSPESYPQINTGEKIGYTVRNFGIAITAVGLVAPSLIAPGLALAASGEVMRRVSKK